MSALYLYVSGLIVATPLQGGGENFRLASLAICHPPDQNAETASERYILYLFLILKMFDLGNKKLWQKKDFLFHNLVIFLFTFLKELIFNRINSFVNK